MRNLLKIQVTGFQGRRVAKALAVGNFLLLPGHFFVSCTMSGRLAEISLLGSSLVTLLCFLPPRKAVNRFFPIVLSWGATLLNLSTAH